MVGREQMVRNWRAERSTGGGAMNTTGTGPQGELFIGAFRPKAAP